MRIFLLSILAVSAAAQPKSVLVFGDHNTKAGGWVSALEKKCGIPFDNQTIENARLLDSDVNLVPIWRSHVGAPMVIVALGMNDLADRDITTGQLTQKMGAVITESRHRFMGAVVGATVPPFSRVRVSGKTHSAAKEATRQAFNAWVRSGVFDVVVDLDKAVRDPANPQQINPLYDSSDGFNLNAAGHKAIADSINVSSIKACKP